MMRLCLSFLFASFLQSAAAQPRLAPPALGYVYDPGFAAIRVIRGAPGAALLAEPVDAGVALTDAVVSPSQEFALVVSAVDGRAGVLRWQDGKPPAVTILEDALTEPARFIFSPSGAAAILRDREHRLQLVTGLPDSPVIRDIPSAAEGAVAVSDLGAVAIASENGLLVVGPDRVAYSLPLSGVYALAFSPVKQSDLLAIVASGDLYLARNVAAGADIRRISYGGTALTDVVGLRFSGNGSSALIAGASGLLSAVDLESGDATFVSCQCAPTDVQPLTPDGLLRVTAVSNLPLFLFDARPRRARVWFVPAAADGRAQ